MTEKGMELPVGPPVTIGARLGLNEEGEEAVVVQIHNLYGVFRFLLRVSEVQGLVEELLNVVGEVAEKPKLSLYGADGKEIK